MTDYRILTEQLRALAETDGHLLPLLSNASALLMEALPELNWAGFYLLRGERLVLGPFQGKTACIHIEKGKGVCGAAVERDEPMLVEDVHLFPGHIACDSASNSELVIPIHRDGSVMAVLDLDSPRTARFTEADKQGLESFAAVLEEKLIWAL